MSLVCLLQDLLGENFRRQMLMDGQYGSITFICTKTDVIQVCLTGACSSLQMPSSSSSFCCQIQIIHNTCAPQQSVLSLVQRSTHSPCMVLSGTLWKLDLTDEAQVSETVRSFSQGGSGKVKLCEAAGVPLKQYEAAQQRVDERQSEFNKHEATIKRCKKKAKPLNRALVGLRKRLKNCRNKLARVEAATSGGPCHNSMQSDSDSASEFESDDDSDDESGDDDCEYAIGDKRKGGKKSESRPKRKRRSPSLDEESDSDMELSMSDDSSNDESSEEVAVPVPKRGLGPQTVPELQAYDEELRAAIEEKSAIVKTLKSEMR